jgi:diadenosine tetraphosphatase ApaH/serine/threonine PP2A family protein phosphatase
MITLAGVKPGDVLAFGHTHLPWHRVVDGVHLVNAGSVGRPKDGDPRAGYTLLDVEEGTLAVRFRRVTYDVERAAAAIESSALPRAFADQLRSGDVRSGRPGSAS